MNLFNILLDEPNPIPKPPIQPANAVYYIPTVLTNIQQDLLELVVEIFRGEIQDIYNITRQKTSIDSLLDNTRGDLDKSTSSNGSNSLNNGGFSANAKINLLYEQLRLIDRHPSLLVDHFIPRKLLLLEVNERMEHMLGKFQLFNRLIDSFLDKYTQEKAYSTYKLHNDHHHAKQTIKPRFNMIVIAQSVKELELIEALIIGKKLYYRNLSSGKLYDDGRGMPKDESHSEQESSSGTPQPQQYSKMEVENGPNGRRKRSKGEEGAASSSDSSSRKPKLSSHEFYTRKNTQTLTSNEQPYEDLCLYLTTSQLAYNHTFDNKIDMIFSFDTDLDLSQPGIDFIRTKSVNQSFDNDSIVLKVPVLIPVSALSIDHFQLKIGKDPSLDTPEQFYSNSNLDELSQRHKWALKIINAFIINRHQLFLKSYNNKDFFYKVYLANFKPFAEWMHNWETIPYPLSENFDEILNSSLDITFKTDSNDADRVKELQANYFYDFGPRSNLNSNDSNRDRDRKIEVGSNSMALNRTIDYKSYKEQVSEIVHDRIRTINNSIETKYKQALSALRNSETIIQEGIDHDNDEIAKKQHELTKSNEAATIAERKLAKAEVDFNKIKNVELALINKLEYLDEILEQFKTNMNKSEDEIDLIINKQIVTIDNLRDEVNSLEQELDRLITEEELLRGQYQENSNLAVQLSHRLGNLQEKNLKVEKKLNGPGARILPSLSRDYETLSFETELATLKGSNKFMDELLSLKLNQIVAERTTAMENSGSVSSSRGSRMSRAATPF